MNKGELVDRIAQKATVTKKQADAVLSAAIETIMEAVADDDKVTLVGFGSFERRHRKEREGRNPKTGEKMAIPETHVPAFSAGKLFKEKVAPKKQLSSHFSFYLLLNRPIHGGNLAWAAAFAGCPASSIKDFSASINPLGPPPQAIAVLRKNLDRLITYPDPNYTQLKDALAQYHQISADYILPGNGSAELLTWAGWELSQQKVTYLITPAFNDYWRALTAFKANWFQCQLNLTQLEQQQVITLADIFSARDFIPANSGLLLNNPHNPTGQIWTKNEILPYLAQFALVVVDEAFMDFLPPGKEQSLISAVEDFPNLVILRSLTKFYSLPGLRIGYAIANPTRIEQWQKFRDPWSVNTLAAIAAETVIQDKHFQQQTWEWLPPTRKKLWQGLASLPGLQPLTSAANFLLVKTAKSSTQLQAELLTKYQILIRDCLSFPELGDRYFRLAVRSQQENNYLLEALSYSLSAS